MCEKGAWVWKNNMGSNDKTDRCAGRCDITGIMLQTALNTKQSINPKTAQVSPFADSILIEDQRARNVQSDLGSTLSDKEIFSSQYRFEIATFVLLAISVKLSSLIALGNLLSPKLIEQICSNCLGNLQGTIDNTSLSNFT